MKTLIIITAAFCLSVSSLCAQDVKPEPTPQVKDTVKTEPSLSYLKEMIKIEPSEIPAQLRSTLESPKFTGWEDGVIYRSKNNDAFVVEMRDMTYQFDGKGKLIKEN